MSGCRTHEPHGYILVSAPRRRDLFFSFLFFLGVKLGILMPVVLVVVLVIEKTFLEPVVALSLSLSCLSGSPGAGSVDKSCTGDAVVLAVVLVLVVVVIALVVVGMDAARISSMSTEWRLNGMAVWSSVLVLEPTVRECPEAKWSGSKLSDRDRSRPWGVLRFDPAAEESESSEEKSLFRLPFKPSPSTAGCINFFDLSSLPGEEVTRDTSEGDDADTGR